MDKNFNKSTETLVVSYRTVRQAIGLIGLMLPILLGPVGYYIFGIPIQNNFSAYYHTELRDVFVGMLFAIAIFLFVYRGYDRLESWSANVAGLASLGIGLLPLDANSDPLLQKSMIGYLHTICGGVFFVTISLYSIYYFPVLTNSTKNKQRNFIYKLSGYLIIASLALILVYFFVDPEIKRELNQIKFLFWMEWICVWSFSIAWLTKGRAILTEIALSLININKSRT